MHRAWEPAFFCPAAGIAAAQTLGRTIRLVGKRSSMLLLPRPSNRFAQLRLPMADASAAVLAEALVAAEDSDREERLARSLASDPPLVLWSLCAASASQSEQPTGTLRQLAGWLIRNGIRCLATWQESFPPSQQRSMADSRRFARLVEASVERAEIGRWDEASHADLLDDERALIDLVHNAAEWLAAASASSAGSVVAAPPDWLIDAIAARAPTISRIEERLDEADRRAARRHAAAARDRWLATGPMSPAFLPRLVARLARETALESRFDKILQAEKLESLAEFAAGAGHEINNPVAVISGRAQLLIRGESDPERRRDLALIHTQAMRVYEMISDMMLFARPPLPQPRRVDLVELFATVIGDLKSKAELRCIELRFQPPAKPMTVHVDPTQITVALRALCDNALVAIGGDGWIEIVIETCPSSGEVRITVRDNGPGLTPLVRRHLFDPYFSGREAGRGLGLGLSKCWKIITQHGGRIDVQSQSGEGTVFTITLPVSGGASSLDVALTEATTEARRHGEAEREE